jgi:hypothetical protein
VNSVTCPANSLLIADTARIADEEEEGRKAGRGEGGKNYGGDKLIIEPAKKRGWGEMTLGRCLCCGMQETSWIQIEKRMGGRRRRRRRRSRSRLIVFSACVLAAGM